MPLNSASPLQSPPRCPLQHLPCGIEAVAQIGGGVGAAADAPEEMNLTSVEPSGFGTRMRGRQLDLDRTVHGAVGADDVEINHQGRGAGDPRRSGRTAWRAVGQSDSPRLYAEGDSPTTPY